MERKARPLIFLFTIVFWTIAITSGRAVAACLSIAGSTASVTLGSTRQTSIVQSGSSYISQEDKRRHFGLGAASEADEVSIKWPDGTVTKRAHVKANQILTIAQ